MSRLSIRHLTRYRYRAPVGFGEHRMMLRPRDSRDQRVLEYHIEISPRPSRLRHASDVFGNCVGIASFEARSRELAFESEATIEHTPAPAFTDSDADIRPCGEVTYSPEELPDLLRSIERRHPDPDGAVEAWARRFLARMGRTSLQKLLAEMTGAICADFAYESRLEKGTRAPHETLSLRAGCCRDFAMLMIESVRSLGLAARYASGYLYSPGGGRRRVEGGGHTHAWASVYLPACGWVEFDPTTGAVGAGRLIGVAVATDPRQATPLHGVFMGSASDFLGMEVEVEVTPNEAAPAWPPARRAQAA